MIVYPPPSFKSFKSSPNNVNTLDTGYVSIEKFGAKAGDKAFDNAPAIMKALKSANKLIIPANKFFYINSPITISNLSRRVIAAYGSTLINLNYNVRTFLFTNCDQIKIIGGYFTRDVLPTVQNGNEQSTLGFKNCKNVSVTNCHIDRSPEMGIDNNVVIGGTFSNNTIEHCLRDGIYAHYSANLKYIGSTLNEIKDDALSIQ